MFSKSLVILLFIIIFQAVFGVAIIVVQSNELKILLTGIKYTFDALLIIMLNFRNVPEIDSIKNSN